MTYLPIFILFIFTMAFVLGTIFITFFLGRERRTSTKGQAFECGVDSQGDARVPFSVRYFLIAILFVLFDVEIIFLYPWAVNFKGLGWGGLGEVVLFTLPVALGFIFLLRSQVLDFDRD